MRLRVLMLAASTAKDKPPDLNGLLPGTQKGDAANNVRHAACVLVDCDRCLVDWRVAEFR